ncbi:MAG: hypothetical protein LKH33_04395 [Acetobacter sp.]|jgi:hypothetical protein|nr:hypothetical protein [Acetobacter sp.]MCH4060810.1 hypothetical protein [Acetobacter sp.]MCH4087750.1 hypothetical protein [Acetobacter sp.]MCI1293733.1 hypothetical protein [Acetobacter sp.]MCI1319917.1 hypothetical protein [Acetobacter sp.]
MIRPFTIFCVFLAFGSGLFLYSKKHQTTVLDKKISDIVENTQHIRQQTAMLRTEWALLNQPDRLTRLAGHFLSDLQPMQPAQFVRMTDLASHLPAPGTNMDNAVSRPGMAVVLASLSGNSATASQPEAIESVEKPIAAAAAPVLQVAANAPPHPQPAIQNTNSAQAAHSPHHAVLVASVTDMHHAPTPVAMNATHHAASPAPHQAVGESKAAPFGLASATPRVVSAPHAAPTKLAVWHPTETARPLAHRTTALASVQSQSLLGHNSLGGGLPPPVPVTN